jgi:hypothetical protein
MNEILKTHLIDNVGGIIKLWYIPMSDVSYITRPIHGYGGIYLKTAKVWLEFYFTPGSGSFSLDFNSAAKGNIFETKIKGSFPKQHQGHDYSIRQMIGQPFVCKVLDANGVYRLAGTLDCPMKFAFDLDTGKKTEDRNSYEYIFSGKSKYSPYFITASGESPA